VPTALCGEGAFFINGLKPVATKWIVPTALLGVGVPDLINGLEPVATRWGEPPPPELHSGRRGKFGPGPFKRVVFTTTYGSD